MLVHSYTFTFTNLLQFTIIIIGWNDAMVPITTSYYLFEQTEIKCFITFHGSVTSVYSHTCSHIRIYIVMWHGSPNTLHSIQLYYKTKAFSNYQYGCINYYVQLIITLKVSHSYTIPPSFRRCDKVMNVGQSHCNEMGVSVL